MRDRNRILTVVPLFALATLFICLSASAGELSRDELSKAEGLHKLKCAKCHKLYDPKDYDDASWENWMDKMRKKARLKDGQYDLILRYTNSLRVGKESLAKHEK